MKLFTISDMGVSTGFARVMESIIQYFPEDWEIHSLGINYRGDPHESRAKIYPAMAGGDIYGLGRLRKLLDKIKPDKIFILQDSWIIYEYLKLLTPAELAITTLYTPVDAGPYLPQWLKDFSKCENVVAYTEYGKQVLQEANPDLEIKIIPHGVDRNKFFPVPQDEARSFVNALNPDLFIVLNPNRNQPRKRIDLALAGFAIFAQDKDNARYHHHAGVEDAGWNVIELGKRFGIADKIILTSKGLSPTNAVSDEVLNLIYNSADVGLNSSTGEGWSLCVHPDTPVLTERGYRPIKDVHKGDYVYTDKGRLRRVTQVYSREYTGKIHRLRVAGSAEEFYVTPEHPLRIDASFVEAQDIVRGMMWFKPYLHVPTEINRIDLSHYFCPDYSDLDYNYFIGKGLKEKYANAEKRKLIQEKLNRYIKKRISQFPRWIELNAETAPLFARIIGTQKEHSKCEKLRGFKPYLPDVTSTISRRRIRDLASTQLIFLAAPQEFLLSYLETLIKERVYAPKARRKAWGMYLRNAAARQCITLLLNRLHIRYSLVRQRVRGTGEPLASSTLYLDKRDLLKYFEFSVGPHVTGSAAYARADLDGTYHKVLENTPIDYSGLVYNLEVDEDHTYLIDGYAVHNCNMEHAIVGKPQVVPNHSALAELYADGRGVLLGIDHYDINTSILTTAAVTSPLAIAEALNYLYYNPEVRAEVGRRGQQFFSDPKFSWENVSQRFRKLLEYGNLAE